MPKTLKPQQVKSQGRQPYKREHEMLLPQVKELPPTSPGLVLSTPGVVLSTQGLVRNSRLLVKNTSRRVRLGRRSGIITLKNALICLVKALFTRTYIRYLFPEKSIHPFTQCSFLLIYKDFECEGFDFKVFTGAAKHSHGR